MTTTIFRGGRVFTGDSAEPITADVAVADGTIVAVGASHVVADLASDETEIVDLAGRMLVPGFIDSHIHPIHAGLELMRCDLLTLRTLPEYLEAIGAYAATLAPDAWVRGGGWSFDAFPGGIPAATDLDRVVGGRPAAFFNRDHHTLWVSTRALELAGIDRGTPDPSDGRIERDAAGNPIGALQEGATALVERIMPATTEADLVDALLLSQDYLGKLGITGWQDAMVFEHYVAPYVTLAEQGRLTANVVGALRVDHNGGLGQVAAHTATRSEFARAGLSFGSVKVMLDGVCENFTASVLEPYENVPHSHGDALGIPFYEDAALREFVREFDAADFQVHFHAVGDAAVRQALDTVEATIAANGQRGNRHHVAHIQVVHPDDIARFGPLELAANAQPLWARLEPQMTELTMPFLGERRSGWQYPFGALSRAGARIVMGSDWPVSTPNPLRELHVAVNRTPAPEGSRWKPEDGVFLPEQRLDLATALSAFTAGSAWINGSEKTTGTISPGKRADLVVVDRDLFAIPSDELWTASVDQTWVGGTAVHRTN